MIARYGADSDANDNDDDYNNNNNIDYNNNCDVILFVVNFRNV